MSKFTTGATIVAALLLFAACEQFQSSDTLEGMWQCNETRSNGERKIYNVDVQRASISDTTLFVVYNMFNLGYDFGMDVKLGDSEFVITGSTNVAYSVSGKGIISPPSEGFAIRWTCNVVGPALNEPYLLAVFRK